MIVARDTEKKVSTYKMLTIQKRDRETITVQPERAMTQRSIGCMRACRLNITFQTSMQEWVTERNSI